MSNYDRIKELRAKGAYGAIAYENAPAVVRTVAEHVVQKYQERKAARVAQSHVIAAQKREEQEAIHAGRLQYLKKSAAKGETQNQGTWGARGQRIMDVMGGGGGGGASGLAAFEGKNTGRSGGGMGGLAAFERAQIGGRGRGRASSGGMGGLAAFEGRALAAAEGRPYKAPRYHELHRKKMHQLNVVVIGGRKYYRGG
jgi:hypothetical protein